MLSKLAYACSIFFSFFILIFNKIILYQPKILSENE